ncbi:fimbrial biogenesis outer membrane usher protein [Pseudomonas sp. PDNC002]|uniref:fimbria/pilus outer membrane usher protein n=1 Tax=Pseudomonas sp. PDNC002 TaxID=2811422 RepID=UPI001964528C|nr:fimbria/pilus outer membrane usher protein [Pseudomonas sp. PDNC002]QRY81681.1 fimbrial biogenesis outer membrane usher protein [Pseudomonas sp. PDNC002]
MICRVDPYRGALLPFTLGTLAMVVAGLAQGDADYRFDDNLLMGSGLAGGSLERFNRADQVDPGTYHVDLYLNGQYATRAEVEFRQRGERAEPCFSERFLRQSLGARPDPLAGKDDQGICHWLSERLPASTWNFDTARLRLDLAVPQALLDIKPRGYVSPDEWDAGSTMGFVNYDANLYRSSFEGAGSGGDSDYGYLGLNGGVNLGLWRLRHQSNYTYSSYAGNTRSDWNSIRTYAQRAVPGLRSELTLGDSYTEGNLFGSMGYRGVRLATDDRMLPDSQRQYAPQVRGTANTNARVVISQNGRKIHETTVAPGPFVIDDLYGTAYDGDLDVQVIEADGSVSRFSVPFSAVPESMRPGLSRYSATVGQARQYGDGNDLFGDLTYQRGLTNALTANLGTRVAEDYLALLGGGVLATPYGAFGMNTTFSSATVENNQRKQGWRVGLNYSRTFQPTQTTLTLAGYRYSTEGYRDLGDALSARDASDHGDTWDSSSYKQRNQFTLLVNQGLGEYGNLYLSGSTSDYYDGKSRDTQLQVGYSNTWRQLSYNLAYSRQQTTWYRDVNDDYDPSQPPQYNLQHGSNRNNTLTLSVSMPLGSTSRAPNLNAMASRRSGDSSGSTYQTGLNGTLGADRTLSYSLSAGRDSEGQGTDFNGSLQKQTSVATLNAGYAESSSYRQVNGGLRGAAVLHSGGLTLGPYVGDTFALVEAKGASGAGVRGGQGARVNSSGYAVVPSLSPYRYNPISLDPQGIDENAELVETERKVAPYAGAAVKVEFKTLTGHPLLIQAKLPDGQPLPLGADVLDGNGVNIGMVGQGGQVYARAEGEKGRLRVQWGERAEDSCQLPYDLKGADPDQVLVRLQATCLPEAS